VQATEWVNSLGKKRGNTNTADIITYLRSLGRENLDLILKYSVWPLEDTPADGIEIFMEDRAKEDELPPRVILDHIKGLRSDTAKKITVPYLQWLINERGEEDPRFHNELVSEYLNKVMDIKSKTPSAPVRAANEKGRLGETRKLLLEFLERSEYYTPERLLPAFLVNDLFEERAILLSRLHEHKEALTTYVHHLRDNRLAEEYCIKHYREESPESRDVYLHLLTVYLQPPKGQEPMLDSAMTLLRRHFDQVNAAKSLALLPTNIPIQELFPYFEAVLRFLSEKKRNSQVISQLLRTENLQVRSGLIQETSVPIKIDEDTDCPVCGRSITGSSAFAHYPNGTVVHYGCCKDPHVCPKTGTRFY
jgi:Vam6/Vps39-like protein vacuolar protein sorting-associated protein 39